MKRSIRFQVKFNFTLHIQLIFQLVRKCINQLLSNGTNLRQTLKPDFTAKPMMMMMKDAMLSFRRTSVTKLIDSIIPIHNIYSQFVPSEFVVGTRIPKTYMAVTPINRQFYLLKIGNIFNKFNKIGYFIKKFSKCFVDLEFFSNFFLSIFVNLEFFLSILGRVRSGKLNLNNSNQSGRYPIAFILIKN